MFANGYGMEQVVLAGLVMIPLFAAARQAGRLAFSRDRRHLLLEIRRLRRLLVCTWAFVFLQIAGFAAAGIHDGWPLIRYNILFILPLMVLPAIASVVFTFPRLASIGSRVSANADTSLTPKDLRATTAPGLVFPVQFAAVCGAIGFWLLWVSPQTPLWKDVMYVSLVLAASSLWLWLKCRVRFDEAVLRPRPAEPRRVWN